MQSASYRVLRCVSVSIFVLSAFLFVSSQLVTVASRRVQVRDKRGEIIVEAWIPHDYGTSQFVCLTILVLSGIQVWTVLHFGKAAHDSQKLHRAEQSRCTEPGDDVAVPKRTPPAPGL